MTYSNHFVMCVLVNGQPIQELANGVVSLPFGTEYSLRFRNKHARRAVVKIFIDGENVSGGGYIIDAHGHVDIKRHHDVDRAFKFVSLDSPDAVDFGENGPNDDKVKGTIEAQFYLEKEFPQTPVIHEIHHHHYPRPRPNPWPYRPPVWYNTHTCGGTTSSLDSGASFSAKGMSAGGARATLSSFSPAPAAAPAVQNFTTQDCFVNNSELKDGCTVEGNVTGQNFHSVSIDLEDTCTVLKLFLQGHETTTYVAASEKPRKTNKSQRVEDLEAENEKLRQKLAELENEQLKEKLANAEKPKAKPKTKAKPKPRSPKA